MKKDILVDALTALMPSEEEVQTLAKQLTEKTGIAFGVDIDNGSFDSNDKILYFGIVSEQIDVEKKLQDNADFKQFVDNRIPDLPDKNSINTFITQNSRNLYRDFLSELTGVSFNFHINGRFIISLSLRDLAMIKALATDNHKLLSFQPDYDRVVWFLNAVCGDLSLHWSYEKQTLKAELLENNNPNELKVKITTALPFPSLTRGRLNFYTTPDNKTCFQIKSLPEINTIARIARRLELYQGINVQEPARKMSVSYYVQQASKKNNVDMPIQIANHIASFFTHNDVPAKGLFTKLINQDSMEQETVDSKHNFTLGYECVSAIPK